MFSPSEYNDSRYIQDTFDLDSNESSFIIEPTYTNQGLSPLLSIGKIDEDENSYAFIKIDPEITEKYEICSSPGFQNINDVKLVMNFYQALDSLVLADCNSEDEDCHIKSYFLSEDAFIYEFEEDSAENFSSSYISDILNLMNDSSNEISSEIEEYSISILLSGFWINI